MRRWVLRLLVLAACLAALGWTLASLGPRRVVAAAAAADPGWLALSALAVVVRYLVWTVKWRTMLRRSGPFPWLESARTLLAGVFVNLTTPTAKLAGGFVRAAMVHRRTGWGFARSYGWSFADQFTNSLGNVLLAGALCLGAVAALPPGGSDRGVLVGLGTAALVGVAVVVSLRGWAWRQVARPAASRWLARLTPARYRTEGPDGAHATWLEPTLAPLLRVGRTWRVVPVDLGLAAASCSFLCVSNVCALRAVGIEAPFVPAAAATVLAGFAGTVAGTVGGIGATELALIGLYGRMEMPADGAAAGALLHRTAYYLVSLGLGGLAIAFEGNVRGGSDA